MDSERNCVSNVRPPHGLSYAQAADTVAARGWSADETATGWDRASWPSLHLLAVCVLARGSMA